MEYTFRNSTSDDVTVITLRDNDFLLHKGQKQETIFYANILSVRIAKRSSGLYQLYVYSDGRKPVIISCDRKGKNLDQARQYALLVRVLHHHLKEKSTAVFSSGSSSEQIWFLAIVSVLGSLTVCSLLNYLGFRFTNVFLETFILSFMAILAIIGLNMNNMPKPYEPSEIPIQFLP